MKAHRNTAESAAMNSEPQTVQARQIAQGMERIKALGYTSGRQIEKATNMSRETVAKMLNGEPVTRTSATRFLEAVDRLDHEMGSDRDNLPKAKGAAEEAVIEFRIGGSFGVEVVVKCTPEQLDATVQAVEALVDRMARKE